MSEAERACDEVTVQLYEFAGRLAVLEQLAPNALPACEQQHAASLKRPKRREEYLAGRILLRGLLAQQFQLAPAHFDLQRGEHGQLQLGGETAGYVSISHSFGLAAVAYSRQQVGVDIERIRPQPKALQLAERSYSSSELELLAALPDHQRDLQFLRLWTAKEAVLKADGRGTSAGLALPSFYLHNDQLHCQQPLDDRHWQYWHERLRFRGDSWWLAVATANSSAQQLLQLNCQMTAI